MATSKTLAPTNVTINIPAMADAPDASVFSNCVDKEADAINALNSNLTKTTKDGSTFTEVNGNITINTSRINSKAGIVTCTIAMKITGAIAAYTKLFTIPVRPNGETNLNLVTLDGTSIPCYVNSSGEVFGRANVPVAQWAQTNFSFME